MLGMVKFSSVILKRQIKMPDLNTFDNVITITIHVPCTKLTCKACDADGLDICYLDKHMIHVSCLNKEKKYRFFVFL